MHRKLINIAVVVGILLMASIAEAALVESIETSCPSDPTQGGKCSLTETKVDGYSCQNIDGTQVCNDWWRKDYSYTCSGVYDADTLLAKVGTEYCSYNNACSEWVDVDHEGGDTSCRIYVDTNRAGCNADSFSYDCLMDECGDLFDRCTQKEYIQYSDILDKANPTTEYYCDPVSGMCGTQQVDGYSGVNLGIYTFTCPSYVTQYCRTYQGDLSCPATCPDGTKVSCESGSTTATCPDGSTATCTNQVCNKVQSCVAEKTVTSSATEIKTCLAERAMTSSSYLKGSSESESAKNNGKCIKIGETTTDLLAQSIQIIGGWDEDGGTKNCFLSTGWDTNCYSISEEGAWESCRTQMNGEANLMHYLNNVYYSGDPAHSVSNVNSVTESARGNYSGCFGSDDNDWDVYLTVNADVKEITENFNCYDDTYDECTFDGLECGRLSSSDINVLECSTYASDADDSTKSLCSKFLINYECPTVTQTTECSEYQEVLQCNDITYPIDNVKTENMDFAADFSEAIALAQAANELKHVWSGESYMCESGLWWLFDQMSLWDYLLSKMMSYAFQYLGAQIMSFTGVSNAISDGLGCMNSVVNSVMGFYKTGYTTDVSGFGTVYNSTTVNIYSFDTTSMTVISTNSAGSGMYTIDTSKSQGCVAAIGQKVGSAVGLTAEQSSKITNFFSNTYVLVALSVLSDIVTSIKSCSTCTDEECASSYNQYKEYSLINNRLCHYIAEDCTVDSFFGCMRTGYKYCCYDSSFARILVEQSYKQLGYSWGSFDSPNCSSLTFDDLSRLDFSSMDFSEFISEIEKKMNTQFENIDWTTTIQNAISSP